MYIQVGKTYLSRDKNYKIRIIKRNTYAVDDGRYWEVSFQGVKNSIVNRGIVLGKNGEWWTGFELEKTHPYSIGRELKEEFDYCLEE